MYNCSNFRKQTLTKNPYTRGYAFVYYSFGIEKTMDITQQSADIERWEVLMASMDFGVKSYIQILAMQFASCVTLEKMLNFLMPQFPLL